MSIAGVGVRRVLPDSVSTMVSEVLLKAIEGALAPSKSTCASWVRSCLIFEAIIELQELEW